ncbi:MAG: glucokinase [Phycisphaeraceae bacterium]|nr:glucokinase [Phycisphaeraceae bacterium]
MLLAGDIGGTKTDLAVFESGSDLRTPLYRKEFVSAKYETLESMAKEFLDQAGARVERACFAVAGPVIGGRASLTNLKWTPEERTLAAALGVRQVRLINDLEAFAWAVPALGPRDVAVLSEGTPVSGGAIAVLAPGTGLGASFLTWEGNRYVAHASEGGHTSFAPADPDQWNLLRFLQERHGHVSWERVCSGMGIPNIYDYLRSVSPEKEDAEVERRLAAGGDRAPVISNAALDPAQPSVLCRKTMELFVSTLGAKAGNLALEVLATGGVMLAGGIPQRILPLLQTGAFVEAMRSKGRMSDLLTRIPVKVITSHPAITGAARCGFETIR